MAAESETSSDGDRSGIIDAIGRAGANGVLALLGIVLEGVLLAWYARANDPGERLAAGGLMGLLLIALIVAVVYLERGRQTTNASIAVQTAAKLDSPSLPPLEIERRLQQAAEPASLGTAPRSEIIGALDGSYIIARPPKGWSIRWSTLKDEVKEKVGLQDLSSLVQLPDVKVLLLQFGAGFRFSPSPGRTRFNGVRLPILLSEPMQRAVRIVTIPHQEPPFYVKRSLYDNLVMLVTQQVQAQIASIVSLTQGKLPKTNRDMMIAELAQEFQDLVMDGKEIPKLTATTTFTAVRGDLVDYVFTVTNYRQGTERDDVADQMDQDVKSLFDSFHMLSEVDVGGKERARALTADESFDRILQENGSAFFSQQFKVAILRLREMDYESADGIAQAILLLRPFRVFAQMLDDKEIDMPDLWDAMDAAERGDSGVLRDLLRASLEPDQGVAADQPATTLGQIA